MKTMPEEEAEGKKLDDEFDDPAQIYDDDEWKKHKWTRWTLRITRIQNNEFILAHLFSENDRSTINETTV
jgi:hypothetical protein